MSRYTFDQGDQRWHVGWEPATTSYFAQVEPRGSSNSATSDELRDVVGGDYPREVATVVELDRRLAGQAEIPADVRTQLEADGRLSTDVHARSYRARTLSQQSTTSRRVGPAR